ncbi:hypothetical protein [uncultured Roseobacter sp.]|uniref:hypothetical protein n=1 Tax=uncultured Roseobacter sp. TaxID=114847 RepID=UPI0026297E37|nr:hypothetical protein [uncultured Roseobacter sp.]
MPVKPLDPLSLVPGSSNLFTARRGAARMMAARLADGALALYSPVPAPDSEAVDAARARGGVAAIIAPSPYHHLGIAAWMDAFPEASLCAPEGACDRLEKRLGVRPSAKMPSLVDGAAFLFPEGLKAPEVWLRAETADGVAWAVCDAFAGPAGTDDAPATEPKARGAFATMCLGDPPRYKAWALAQIERDQPTQLFPAHGNRVAGTGLAMGLKDIVEGL